MNEGLTLETITSNYKEEFGRNARSYVIFLFKGTQGLTRFTTDIVKGLGSFDLGLLLVDPLENAAYCFMQLFTSFRLRGVFQFEEESIYTEEYVLSRCRPVLLTQESNSQSSLSLMP